MLIDTTLELTSLFTRPISTLERGQIVVLHDGVTAFVTGFQKKPTTLYFTTSGESAFFIKPANQNGPAVILGSTASDDPRRIRLLIHPLSTIISGRQIKSDPGAGWIAITPDGPRIAIRLQDGFTLHDFNIGMEPAAYPEVIDCFWVEYWELRGSFGDSRDSFIVASRKNPENTPAAA